MEKPTSVQLSEIAGKTVKETTPCSLLGPHGEEPAVTLVFTDDTSYTFVLPLDRAPLIPG